jgi:hypothetical protein
MEGDGARGTEVERIGAATSHGTHSHNNRTFDSRTGFQYLADRVDGDQGQVARKKEHRIRTAFDCSSDAARRSHVLPFLNWLEKDFGAQGFRHLGDFIVTGNDQESIPCRCRFDGELSVVLRERPPLFRSQRRS